MPSLCRLRLVLAAALVLLGASEARAATSPEYAGVNIQPLQQNRDIAADRWPSFLQHLADGEMRIHRIQADWWIMQPSAPVNGVDKWVWNADGGGRNSMDWTITQLATRGLRAVPTLNNSPNWARAPGTMLPDSSFQSYVNFSIAYIQRYGPGGSFWAENPQLPQLPATHYELWNEANSPNFWTGKTDPAAYARFLKYVYPRIKAAAPSVVLMPSIGWEDAAKYLGDLAREGAGASMDAIAFHPYAPSARSMLGLVSALRTTLGNIGRPEMPILVTESGQPAKYDGTGKLHAYDGPVNDDVRAATQSLTLEALARSDCSVQSYLVYAVTGTETNREILNEGFMGILRYADAAPNATGQALQRASRRWAASATTGNPTPNGRLVVCGQGTTRPQALLPLSIEASRGSSGGCVRATTRFDGNLLEEVDFVLETPDGRVSRNGTNATGTTESCVPAGPNVAYVDVYSELKNVAKSQVLRCDIPVTTCFVVRAANVADTTAPVCTVQLRTTRPVRNRTGKRSSMQVRAKLQCDAYKTFRSVRVRVQRPGLSKSGKPRYQTKIVRRVIKPRFTVAYRRPGKKESRIRYVTLQHGKTVRFTVNRVIRRGDQLVLLHRVNAKRDALPRVRVTSTLPAPKAAPKRKAAAKKR